MNIAGLISGNLKRHLIAAHGYGQLVFDLFGGDLALITVKHCDTCKSHVTALDKELSL